MTTRNTNLTPIAIDVVGHCGQTAKNLVATYRAGTERAVHAISTRYEQLLGKQPLPWLSGEVKANLVGSQQRVARRVVDSVDRLAARASGAVDRVSGRTVQGLEAFDQRTAWANDLLVVGAIRTINLPVAKASLRIAGRADDASRRLSRRVAGTTVAKAAKAAKTTARRVRRAVRAA